MYQTLHHKCTALYALVVEKEPPNPTHQSIPSLQRSRLAGEISKRRAAASKKPSDPRRTVLITSTPLVSFNTENHHIWISTLPLCNHQIEIEIIKKTPSTSRSGFQILYFLFLIYLILYFYFDIFHFIYLICFIFAC